MQSIPVDLAIDVTAELIDNNPIGRDHVVRQLFFQCGFNWCQIERLMSGFNIGHNILALAKVLQTY